MADKRPPPGSNDRQSSGKGASSQGRAPADPSAKPSTSPPKPLAGAKPLTGAKPLAGARPIAAKSGKSSELVRVSQGKVQLSTGGARAGSVRPGDVSEERIEDFVLAQSWMQDAKVEPLLQAFFDRLAPKISLGATTFGVIKAFSNIDERAVKVADVLRANPYYEYHFLEVVNSLSKREETPGTDTAVVLLGMQNSRDLIIAMQMMRTVFDSHPEWRPDGKLDLEPPEVLRFARKTEQIFEGDKEMANIAYAAGLIFDLLVLLAGRYSDDSKKVIAFIEHIYNHGLRSAHVGMAIADTIPDFPVKRLVFAASLVHDVGKAAMAILNLDYLQFNELSIKKELTRQVRLHAEGIRYGVHHAAIGGLICRYFESLYQVEKAVLFHHDPYLLARRNRSDHQLASLVCLASNVANHFKRPDRPDDPVLKSWKGRELDAFTVGKTDLIEAVTRVMRERS